MENTALEVDTTEEWIRSERSVQLESVLKWSSYFFIGSFIFTFCIGLGLLGLERLDEQLLDYLTLLYLAFALYCTHKCGKELRAIQLITFFTKVKIFFEILALFLFFHALIGQTNSNWFPLHPIKRELELQESDASQPEKTSNLLQDFILFLKKK